MLIVSLTAFLASSAWAYVSEQQTTAAADPLQAYVKEDLAAVSHTGDANHPIESLVGRVADRLADSLLDRVQKASPLRLKDLQNTVLGKPGHLATSTSHLSRGTTQSTFRSRALQTSHIADRLRIAPNVIAHGLPMQRRSQPSGKTGKPMLAGAKAKTLHDQSRSGRSVATRVADIDRVAPRFEDIDRNTKHYTIADIDWPTTKQWAKQQVANIDFQTVSQRTTETVRDVSRLWLGGEEIPVASYSLPNLELFGKNIGDLLSGALFVTIQRLQQQYGDVYLLPTGPSSSFLVLSTPAAAKHVLESYKIYEKGLVREISQFLFGDGFVVADGAPWKIRRRAIAPAFHKKFLDTMVQRTFVSCSERAVEALLNKPGYEANMEKVFSELTLDIIGKAVFNYDFNSVNEEGSNPVIEAVYTALKEVEARSLDFTPVWKPADTLGFPEIARLETRQRNAQNAVSLIRKTTEDLIENCRIQLEAEEAAGKAAEFHEEDYLADSDPSMLRFLIASKEEVRSSQLRDDLLGMLVAGHETTASVLTWTLYLLTQHPEKMARVQEEIDTKIVPKINSGNLSYIDLFQVNYLRWCVAESMRLYPHPPVLIRRALQDDVLPGGEKVNKGQDVMISVYNIHHSESVWSNPDDFMPERWSDYNTPRDSPNERNTNYHYIPFSGGARRCVGDQFALLESYTALSVLLSKFDFQLVKGQDIGMATGATIHTTNGMRMTYTPRKSRPAQSSAHTSPTQPSAERQPVPA